MSQSGPTNSEAVARHLLEVTKRGLAPVARALNVVPDEQLADQPVPEQFPIGKMIEHVFGSVAFTARALRMGKCEEGDVADLMGEDEATGTRPRILEMSQIATGELDQALAELDDEAASRTIEFFFGWRLTGVETATLGFQELCHHRGQIQSFLRLMGYEPPDIYAPGET